MAHYAKVVDGIVTQVIVAEADFFNTFVDSSAGKWIQTSYNTHGGVHYGQDGEPDGGVALRYNYAGIGYHYDSEGDAFYEPSPFPSWVLDKTTYTWQAPVAEPTDAPENQYYDWDEETLTWVLKDIPQQPEEV